MDFWSSLAATFAHLFGGANLPVNPEPEKDEK